MALTAAEKMKAQKELPEVEKVETDHENLHLSRDEFEAKYRKKKEIKSKLKIEQARLERELEEEVEEKPRKTKKTETTEEV